MNHTTFRVAQHRNCAFPQHGYPTKSAVGAGQTSLGLSTVLSLSYVGSQAHHLLLVYSTDPGNPALYLALSKPSAVAPGSPTCGPTPKTLFTLLLPARSFMVDGGPLEFRQQRFRGQLRQFQLQRVRGQSAAYRPAPRRDDRLHFQPIARPGLQHFRPGRSVQFPPDARALGLGSDAQLCRHLSVSTSAGSYLGPRQVAYAGMDDFRNHTPAPTPWGLPGRFHGAVFTGRVWSISTWPSCDPLRSPNPS